VDQRSVTATGPRPRVLVAATEDLDPELFDRITTVCERAFDEPFARVWDRVGPGIHVVAEVDGRVVAHAMVVDRRLYLGHETDLALDAGYVENVATDPAVQGRGHGALVMREINRIVGDEYVLGALATGSHGFYEKLGWETWRGPTYVRMADGQRVRSADEDGAVMVLRTPRTPSDVDVRGSIAVDWRPDEPW
jgi:aminoglycoside 2'-N-acetyltransferase I